MPSCQLNAVSCSTNATVFQTILMSDMQLGSLWGVRIFGRGVRKKGGSDEPLEPPPGYGPDVKKHIGSVQRRKNISLLPSEPEAFLGWQSC